ncbi:hypothetical protein PO124_12870 [Bacillus licheniformis]|nr:hypothetical protein [Bacillus licheniformis]
MLGTTFGALIFQSESTSSSSLNYPPDICRRRRFRTIWALGQTNQLKASI